MSVTRTLPCAPTVPADPAGLGRALLALAVALACLVAAGTPARAETNAPPAGPSLPEFFARLKTATHASPDPALKPLGSELAAKIHALSGSLTNSPDATASLGATLESLLGKRDLETLAALWKLAAFRLPPEQLNLLRDVRDAGTAYLVQKNLGTIAGVQNDVALLNLALRQGRTADALEDVRKLGADPRVGAAPKAFLEALAGHLTPAPKKPSPAALPAP